MIISHRKRFIFFACGKTGSTSIEQILGRYHDDDELLIRINKRLDFLRTRYSRPFTAKHVRPELVRELVGEEIWDNYYKFVFVRNPWDWVVSNFFYNFGYLAKSLVKFDEDHFNAVWYHLKLHNQSLHTDNYFQHTFIEDENGSRLTDFFGRYEKMQEDFDIICKKINIRPVKVPKINRTHHRPYRELYTEKAKQLVAGHYQKDISILGYKFDDADHGI